MNVTEQYFREILDIGIALTTEKNYDRLFELIIDKAMKITHCDGGTLYLFKEGFLHFKIMRTISLDIYKGGDGEKIELPPVALKEGNVCAYSAIHKEVVNIEDVYHSDTFDFSGPKKYDAMTGYLTQSMLVIPLENHENELIGVLQLINAQNEENEVIAFDKKLEEIVLSLASQTAVSVSNMKYIQEIKDLLYSFVSAFATAVDQRTPYNGNHTRNVTKYTSDFVDFLNQEYAVGNYQEHFEESRKEELVLAANLHDIGKLSVPLSVMDKSTRLDRNLEPLLMRYELIKSYLHIDCFEQRISQKECERQCNYLDESEELVQKVNSIGFLPDNLEVKIIELASKSYETKDHVVIEYLTEYEKDCLLVKKGTLTPEERRIMESHVEMTGKILDNIRFSSQYKNVPLWASSHHEFLNGTGYPKKLTSERMPAEMRILALIDIYDALTAKDRPYKRTMPVSKAVSVLYFMADEGKLDQQLVALFDRFIQQ